MPDLGTKYECTSCSTKFYDLGKPEPICPKCGLNQLAEEEEEPAPVATEEAEEEAEAATEEATEEAAADEAGETEADEALVEEAVAEEEGDDEKPDK